MELVFKPGLMQNHTAVHVLNSVLNEELPLTCQRSSLVTPDYFRHEFSVYSVNIDPTFINQVESKVNELIGHPGTNYYQNFSVQFYIMDTWGWLLRTGRTQALVRIL